MIISTALAVALAQVAALRAEKSALESSLGGQAAIDYKCWILMSGSPKRLGLRATGAQMLHNGKPVELNQVPVIDNPHFVVIEDEGRHFETLQHTGGTRFAGRDNDVVFTDRLGLPKALIRFDYYAVDQADRAIILYVPDPKLAREVTTLAGTCTLSKGSVGPAN